MIVLSEDSAQLEPSASERDNEEATLAARRAGCDVYSFSADFEIFGTAAEALEHVPAQAADTPGLWIGFIPSPERYRAVYTAAREKRILLLNDPEEHLLAMELDRYYPLLEGLTPESAILTDPSESAAVAARLGLPLFVKGVVKSRKAKGFKACVAESVEGLRAMAAELIADDARSRGRAVARRLLRLRHSRTSQAGFPLGREYRVFLYRGAALGFGYYWPGEDPLQRLAAGEERAMLEAAGEAARRLPAPYLAVDVAQLEDGRWIVIEVGDAQFAGLSQTPKDELFQALRLASGG